MMNTRQFKNAVPSEVKKHLIAILPSRKHRDLVYSMAAGELFEDQIDLFSRFVQSPGFRLYARSRAHISLSRMEETLLIFFRRLGLEIQPEKLGEIAGKMSSKKYSAIERTFFHVPVDRDTYRLFEKTFISLGEQNISLIDPYLEFCSSKGFIELKEGFLYDRTIFTDIFERLMAILSGTKSFEKVESAVLFITHRACRRFIKISSHLGFYSDCILNLFNVIQHHPKMELFLHHLEKFFKRYPPKFNESGHERDSAFIYHRLKQIWNYLWLLDEEGGKQFEEFLKTYGHPKDEFEVFVWDTVFELESERAAKAILIFVSYAFSSLKSFYLSDTATLRFLVKNIVAVLAEIEIRDIQISLYRIVLKLLLALKVDRDFLKRRAEFFQWLKSKTSSMRLEIEIIRFLFFEYIYIALRLIDNRLGMKMTRYCDDMHKLFARTLDFEYAQKFYMRGKDRDTVFGPMLEALRTKLWSPIRKKFSGHEALVNEIISVAESIDKEDEIILSLEAIEIEDITEYHRTFIDTFRSQPERMDEALTPDFWYRINLNTAMPHVLGITVPLLGTISILPGTMGAYTDGHSIHLPEYINFFKDPLEPLVENRNLTAYVGMALHETGHILGGSFLFDINYYLQKLEKPELFSIIMNVFEDFRIEEFMCRIGAHFQTREIFKEMNRFLNVKSFESSSGLGAFLLFHISSEASETNDLTRALPEYEARLSTLLSAPLNTGRFRGMKELIEYGISRLRNLEFGNPLACYEISREFYEIMKLWPEAELIDLLELSCILKGVHRREPCAGVEAPAPMTKEELEDFYRQCNENPEEFLKQYGLPFFPELFKGEDKNIDGKEPKAFSRIDEYVQNIIDESRKNMYAAEGTIDYSHRTKLDDLMAEGQTKKRKEDDRKNEGKPDKKKDNKKAAAKKEGKKKFVYSIDPRTKSRTRLSEIREFTVKVVSTAYLAKFRKWEYLERKVYQQLALILPSVKEEHDTSAFEGEINLDLLIEVLSNRNHFHSFEFLDIYRETHRSLGAIIGLDASGSTALPIQNDTILDIEKAFAIILGRALSYLTPNVSLLAFNSMNSTNVYRCASIDAASSFTSDFANRDGDFIRYVKHLFEQSDEELKYFFLISDGCPESVNYSGKAALDDTLIAMREVVNAGIRLIYFNIDLERREYFEVFKREATYAEHFTNPVQILHVIPEIVKKVAHAIK